MKERARALDLFISAPRAGSRSITSRGPTHRRLRT